MLCSRRSLFKRELLYCLRTSYEGADDRQNFCHAAVMTLVLSLSFPSSATISPITEKSNQSYLQSRLRPIADSINHGYVQPRIPPIYGRIGALVPQLINHCRAHSPAVFSLASRTQMWPPVPAAIRIRLRELHRARTLSTHPTLAGAIHLSVY